MRYQTVALQTRFECRIRGVADTKRFWFVAARNARMCTSTQTQGASDVAPPLAASRAGANCRKNQSAIRDTAPNKIFFPPSDYGNSHKAATENSAGCVTKRTTNVQSMEGQRDVQAPVTPRAFACSARVPRPSFGRLCSGWPHNQDTPGAQPRP